MAAISEKGKALLKWCPSDKFRDEYARIFGGKIAVQLEPCVQLEQHQQPTETKKEPQEGAF